MPDTERILGLDFFTGTLDEACRRALAGGLVLAPSAPGLADDLIREPAYRAALEAGDLVLTDSSLLVRLWRLRAGRRLPRHSGLAFLRAFLQTDVARRPGAVFWIMPSEAELRRNLDWLRAQGLPGDERDCYLAPRYGAGPLTDAALVPLLEARRPAVVVIAIGGGVQERLGHFLRERLSFRPGIFCLGAAIAFLSGNQVAISSRMDRWGLGWLCRIVSDTRRYAPRYLRAVPLVWLVFRYGRKAPPFALAASGRSR